MEALAQMLPCRLDVGEQRYREPVRLPVVNVQFNTDMTRYGLKKLGVWGDKLYGVGR